MSLLTLQSGAEYAALGSLWCKNPRQNRERKRKSLLLHRFAKGARKWLKSKYRRLRELTRR